MRALVIQSLMTDSARQPERSIFERTRATELERARGGDLVALDNLIRKYRAPLKIYFCFVFPSLMDRADELLQDFAQDRMLREGWLRKVDLERGRFRDFLKTSLRNFVLNWIRQNQRERNFESLDNKSEEELDRLEVRLAAREGAAADAYDLEWLRRIVSETLRRMEADCRQSGHQQPRRGQTWEIFNIRVLQPAFEDAKPPPYDELAKRFGLRSPTEGTNLLLSAKRIFERHLLDIVAEYQSQGQSARAELEELKEALLRLVRKK